MRCRIRKALRRWLVLAPALALALGMIPGQAQAAGTQASAASSGLLACHDPKPERNSVCQLMALGWQPLDPAAVPLWFRAARPGADGLEMTIAPTRIPEGPPGQWVARQLNGGTKAQREVFRGCQGNLPDKRDMPRAFACAPVKGRTAAAVAIRTGRSRSGTLVIGMLIPPGMDQSQVLRTWMAPLIKLGIQTDLVVNASKVSRALYGDSDYFYAPGRGVPPEEIVNIYQESPRAYNTMYGMQIDYGKDYVLFRNGEVWHGPAVAPGDADIARAKEARPQDWGRWKKQGKEVVVTMNGEAAKALSGGILYAPMRAGQRLDGTWTRTRGGAGGGVAALALHSLTLRRDGRFEDSSSASAISGNAAGGGSSPRTAGRYEINGFELALHYDGGKTVRKLFYSTGGEHNTMFIDGSPYLRRGR